MVEDLFQRRLRAFQGEGDSTAFNLAVVAEGLDIIAELNEQNVGGDTVEQRMGEYKSWDPEIFKVDKDTEDQYIRRLEELGSPVTVLSEEVGRKELNRDAGGQARPGLSAAAARPAGHHATGQDGTRAPQGRPPVAARMFAVCDPFDGSYLFKRGIPDFWYSSLALFDESGEGLSCAVGDGVHRKIAFANDRGAFIAEPGEDGLAHKFKLDADYRNVIGRPDVTEIEKASIESYAMKPAKFLLPLVDEYRDLLTPFKFFLPNGGPYAFADVAEGKIDCYFARQQPHVDVFSGILVALKAGAVVTDFEGNEVKFTEDVETVHDVLATTNRALHDKVLQLIADCNNGS